MKLDRKTIMAGVVALLAVGMAAAQNRPGTGRRRAGVGRWERDTGPVVYTEGGDPVNEDTVRTARETASHSTGTPDWTNAPGFKSGFFPQSGRTADSGGWANHRGDRGQRRQVGDRRGDRTSGAGCGV